jgi:hypothetical protein
MGDEDLGAEWWVDAPVYWAQGVLAERLGVTVDEADSALRAHAARTGTPLRVVAHEVVRFSLLIDPCDYR